MLILEKLGGVTFSYFLICVNNKGDNNVIYEGIEVGVLKLRVILILNYEYMNGWVMFIIMGKFRVIIGVIFSRGVFFC